MATTNQMATMTAPAWRGGSVVSYQNSRGARLVLCRTHTNRAELSDRSLTSVAVGQHWGVCQICALGALDGPAVALRACDEADAEDRQGGYSDLDPLVRSYCRDIFAAVAQDAGR